jgi:predicted dinucleotide-binding enzyme
MRIGIIGINDRALAIGRLLAGGGHDVSFSDPSGGEAAQRVAGQIGAGAETPYRQAITREMLILACDPERVDDALASLGSGVAALAFVDALDGRQARGSRTDAETLAHKLDSHRVVRALIVLPQSGANIPICGDDPQAKALVEQAFAACNCITTDRGPLANATELEPKRAA